MNLTYEEALEVAEWLSLTPTDHIEHSDLISALINALNRIHALEAEVEELRKAAR